MKKKFRITVQAKTPFKDNNKIREWGKLMLEFIREWFKSKDEYYDTPYLFCGFSRPELIELTFPKECFYLSFICEVRCDSPYFYIKDMRYYEE